MIMSWTPTTVPIFVEIGPKGSAPNGILLKYNLLITYFFLSSPTAKTGGRTFTIYTSNDADSHKDVPFGGFDDEE